MKKVVLNIMASTGIILLVLSAVAVMHCGFIVTHRLDFRYPILEIMADISYTLAITLLKGAVFNWYRSTPVWVLVIMVFIILFVPLLFVLACLTSLSFFFVMFSVDGNMAVLDSLASLSANQQKYKEVLLSNTRLAYIFHFAMTMLTDFVFIMFFYRFFHSAKNFLSDILVRANEKTCSVTGLIREVTPASTATGLLGGTAAFCLTAFLSYYFIRWKEPESLLAEIYNVHMGDDLAVTADSVTVVYTVGAIAENAQLKTVYVDAATLSRDIKAPTGSYNGVWSMSPVPEDAYCFSLPCISKFRTTKGTYPYWIFSGTARGKSAG